MRLLKENGTLHITEIGERLQLARAQMTHLIDKLVELGMVERQADSADRRVTNIVLTDKGSDFLRGTRRQHMEGNQRVFIRPHR